MKAIIFIGLLDVLSTNCKTLRFLEGGNPDPTTIDPQVQGFDKFNNILGAIGNIAGTWQKVAGAFATVKSSVIKETLIRRIFQICRKRENKNY